MAGFSATDAAFTGFRVVWQRPWAAAVWAALQISVKVGYTLFVTLSAGPQFMKAADASLTFNPDPAPLLALLTPLVPTLGAIIVGWLVLQAVLSAAMNRAVLRPEESRFGYLRLATDELRQLGLLALMTVLGLLLYFGVFVIAGIIFGLLGFAGGTAGLTVATLFLIPLIIVVLVFAGVRFSLASAQTFASGRINLFGSWALTRGRFWSLFWAYALALVMWCVVAALTSAISIFAVAILNGGLGALFNQNTEPDFTSLAKAFTPATVVSMILSAIGSALGLPITATPPATIYRALTGGGAAAASRVFD